VVPPWVPWRASHAELRESAGGLRFSQNAESYSALRTGRFGLAMGNFTDAGDARIEADDCEDDGEIGVFPDDAGGGTAVFPDECIACTDETFVFPDDGSSCVPPWFG